MKSFLSLLTVLMLLLAACANTDESAKQEKYVLDLPLPVDSAGLVAEPVDSALPEKVLVPEFSNPEVGQSIADYQKIKDAYIAALKAQDAMKIQDLNMAYMDWYQRTEEIVGQLKGEELESYKKVLAELNQEWEVAAEQAVN